MIEVFNALDVDVACLGNHDFDFGIKKLSELVQKTSKTKWVISNLIEEDL